MEPPCRRARASRAYSPVRAGSRTRDSRRRSGARPQPPPAGAKPVDRSRVSSDAAGARRTTRLFARREEARESRAGHRSRRRRPAAGRSGRRTLARLRKSVATGPRPRPGRRAAAGRSRATWRGSNTRPPRGSTQTLESLVASAKRLQLRVVLVAHEDSLSRQLTHLRVVGRLDPVVRRRRRRELELVGRKGYRLPTENRQGVYLSNGRLFDGAPKQQADVEKREVVAEETDVARASNPCHRAPAGPPRGQASRRARRS